MPFLVFLLPSILLAYVEVEVLIAVFDHYGIGGVIVALVLLGAAITGAVPFVLRGMNRI